MNQFMQRAVAEARVGSAKNHGGPFGAVIVRKGRIIAAAHNEVVKRTDPTAHAEILAIQRACAKLRRFELSDCELYASCEPCPLCRAAILWARIPVVHYGADRRDAAAVGFADAAFHDILAGRRTGTLRISRTGSKECRAAMKEWSRRADRVLY